MWNVVSSLARSGQAHYVIPRKNPEFSNFSTIDIYCIEQSKSIDEPSCLQWLLTAQGPPLTRQLHRPFMMITVPVLLWRLTAMLVGSLRPFVDQ